MFQENQSPGDLFELIPNEILLQIFLALPKSSIVQCALVSRRWRDVAYDASLWKVVQFGDACLQTGALRNILERGTTNLVISSCTKVNFADATLYEAETDLKQLEIKSTEVDLVGLCSFISRCPKLTELSLYLPYFDDEICALISQFKDLTYLYLGSPEEISPIQLSKMVHSCRKLKELCIDSLYGVVSVKMIFAELPATIENFSIPQGFLTEIFDEDISMLVTNCPNISYLDLGFSQSLTAKSLQYILELKKLQHLDVSGCVNVAVSSWRVLHMLDQLQTLRVNCRTPDKQLEILKMKLPGVLVTKKC